MRRRITFPDDCLVWSRHGFHFCRFGSASWCDNVADSRGLCSSEGKEMSGILIAGALVAAGLLVYLLVALFDAENYS
jgi:K+-transporting ATPase KdpF subunit